MKLPKEKEDYFYKKLKEISKTSRFNDCKEFMQHGDTSVWEHCVQVAYTAYSLAYNLKIEVSEDELIRGALLHDYFMYDWHEKNWANKIHGYTHPKKAYLEAMKDYDLTSVEKDMILHHMFPLTPMPPTHREAILLCIADKMCATKETVDRRKKSEKRLARINKIQALKEREYERKQKRLQRLSRIRRQKYFVVNRNENDS